MSAMAIPFNQPFWTDTEITFVTDAIRSGKLSGDGHYTRACKSFFSDRYGMVNPMLTTSCTDALEMSAILANIGPGDEVIVPSYTFVSTANAFVLRGAKIVFADSGPDNPNVTPESISRVLTKNTKAVVVVHYAGIACDLSGIRDVIGDGVFLIEDAAQAIESQFNGVQLGTIGDFGAFSFHETKNIVCGEGGLLNVKSEEFRERAEIIREKGTNRSSFFRGEIDKYGWVDIGSSFLPSDILAAYLYAQLTNIEFIQDRRIKIWHMYYERLKELASSGKIGFPFIPSWATNNAHMFYIVVDSERLRNKILDDAKSKEVGVVFHYQALHRSGFGCQFASGELPNADKYSTRLVRLPLYVGLDDCSVDRVCDLISGNL